MNKTAIKNFAVWARKKLIDDITYKAGLIGVREDGIIDALPQSTDDLLFLNIGTKEYAKVEGKTAISQRKVLIEKIRDKEEKIGYDRAYNMTIEEIAYTWFNRLIAIRFMEVNDYLPTRCRVLSSEIKHKDEPDFVTNPFDTELDFSDKDREKIYILKENASKEAADELFNMLFTKVCHNLHEIFPDLFGKKDDYMELLLNVSFTDKNGLIYHLVHDIEEDYFNVEKEGQVEIIGWLYQYYISDKHDQIINIYKGTVKKEDIPAATQLFTTDWVVRYMVDNSLGRYWIERHPKSRLAEKLEFFVTPKDGSITYIDETIEPEELTFFDPCMGSGHILVYAFDVLMEIYRECGYTDRDAAISILENNLFGLDIDKRAYQLAYFAVMMKARSYNRRLFSKDVKCNVTVLNESNGMNRFTQENVTLDEEQNKIGEYLIHVFKDAKEIGSLQTVTKYDYDNFEQYLSDCEVKGQLDIFLTEWSLSVLPQIQQFVKQAKILSNKYAVVCTNPPYMGKLEGELKKFVTDKYKPYSGDLFSVFMYRNFGFCKENGYSAFMTPFVWMFIKTYENLRKYIIENKHITTLVQMEYSAFEEATVPICSFVLQNKVSTNDSLCFRLSEFKGGMEVQKVKVLEAISNKNCGYFFETQQNKFTKIPGIPIAFWASNQILKIFTDGKALLDIADVKKGLDTGNNNQFLRMWYEVSITKCAINHNYGRKKWFPLQKGGAFRKWYGNNEYVINWENNGIEIKATGKASIRSPQFYFLEGISWSTISSSYLGMRYVPEGYVFETAGNMMFFKDKQIQMYALGFLCGKIPPILMNCINPTITTTVGSISILPIIISELYKQDILKLTEQSVQLSSLDWNSFENSWDYTEHPFVRISKDFKQVTKAENFFLGSKKCNKCDDTFSKNLEYDPEFQMVSLHDCRFERKIDYTLEDYYKEWEKECNDRFYQLKSNEEELNRIFIDIYGLQDELTPEVEEKDVTVRKADLGRDIRSLISYAVGCMFGRYSLDEPGLAYAGGEWNDSKYTTFIPDKDNCIPITDEAYFEDDIVGQFVGWMKKAFGTEHLEENLDFIAKALGNKGTTSREVIRNYFLSDFIKDHNKIYQKRPIYWLFDSGKQNGFKALVYMHRWDADTVGNLRVEYLHKMQHIYEREMIRMQETIDNSSDSREISNATKRKDKLQKQLKETKDYDAKLAHIAHARIEIDLDDGVKVNYEKVQTDRDGNKMQILAKI